MQLAPRVPCRSWGQFNKEIQVYFTSRTLVFTNSHQFESTKSLYKFLLEASNLYFDGLLLDSISYKSKIYMRTTLVVSLLNWPLVNKSHACETLGILKSRTELCNDFGLSMGSAHVALSILLTHYCNKLKDKLNYCIWYLTDDVNFTCHVVCFVLSSLGLDLESK